MGVQRRSRSWTDSFRINGWSPAGCTNQTAWDTLWSWDETSDPLIWFRHHTSPWTRQLWFIPFIDRYHISADKQWIEWVWESKLKLVSGIETCFIHELTFMSKPTIHVYGGCSTLLCLLNIEEEGKTSLENETALILLCQRRSCVRNRAVLSRLG